MTNGKTMTSSVSPTHPRGEPAFHWGSFVVGLIMLLLVIAQGIASGLPGYVGMAGLILLLTGVYSFFTHRPSWLWLHHRRDAAIVGVIGLAAFLTALVIRLNGG
ncbi:hypothetical protein KKR91_03405 [Arthrobacter jiangjiafuii]|uniref:Uncharacterized protein n=1 Tax=Arthrobacter jiangjiafuii TaxID=2817475 RepID=A0A975M6R3_9MICC|nr:hypothetical protein [Arthrobacter jiangjiafuii]QWC10689.1 hypothetical protein KKR91_03405 [Arthrobacter jiangjiafuii]